MRRRAARPRYRNMRQRCQVMESKPLTVKIWAQLTIRNTRTDCHSMLRRIDCNYFVHRLHRQEAICTVGNIVEAMTRAQYLKLVFLLDIVPHLFDRRGGVQAVSAVLEITRPVFESLPSHPRQQARYCRDRYSSSEELDKASLIHS